jgi:type IV pilus assembly protein PilE
MHKLSNFARRRSKGFTLIELMVVVAVATILTVIAVPSYLSTVRKSHRSEAKSILMDLAGREERYLATNGSYTNDITQLGFSVAWGQPVGSGYYTIASPTITAATVSSAAVAATPPTYSITATTNGGQVNDTNCAQFTVNSSGLQTSLNSAAAVSTGCW